MTGTHFTADWFTANGPEWLRLLADFPTREVHGLEVGSYEGRSAHWLLQNLFTYKGSGIVCIDSWDGHDPCLEKQTLEAEARFDKNLSEFPGKYTKVKGKSRVIIGSWVACAPSFDLVFIDGDHERYEALTDLMLTWPLVVPGGWLAFDDYGWEDPRLRAQPSQAFDAWVSVVPAGIDRVLSVGRLKFVQKKKE